MLVTVDGTICYTENNLILQTKKCKYYCNGFMFVYGKSSGKESLEYLSEKYKDTNEIPFEELHGSFSIAIQNNDGSIIMFTDNSHMHVLYVHEDAISSNYLNMIEYLKEQGKNDFLTLNKEAIAEQFSIGRTFFNKTFFNQIKKSDSFMYYIIKNKIISEKEKNIKDIDEYDNFITPKEYFDYLSKALSNKNVSVALTGGYDSKMVYAFLRNRIKVQPAISGDNQADLDIIISKKVADSVGDNMKTVRTNKPTMDSKILNMMFKTFDATISFVRDSGYRLYNYYSDLGQSNFNIHITGDGGVLHKDWEWMQDLPFYRKRKTNLNKFYNQRLAFNFNCNCAGDFINDYYKTMQEVIIKNLEKYKRKINTESYDMLYYHVNGKIDINYNYSINGVQLYAPLLEKDLVAYSYALPRSKRFFYNNMRHLTSLENKTISRIPTCYKTTSSDEPLFIIRDIIFQILEYGKKAIRLIGRKLFKKTFLVDAHNTWSIKDDLIKMDEFNEAFELCKRIHIISKECTPSQLNRNQIECILQIYFLIDYAKLKI